MVRSLPIIVKMPNAEPDKRMLGVLLRQPLRALLTELHEGMAVAGYPDLRPAHSAVFMNLDSAGTRITDLAERAQMTKQSMGALVKYLESRGYVSTASHPHDGRAKVVRLTAKGRATEEPARRNIRRVQEKWSRRLGRGEMEEFMRLLRKLNDTIASYNMRTS
jgi:DNA-binding MarR family transcriptional regulator